MDNNQKLAVGIMLATIGAFGIIVFPLLGWSQIESPWDFIVGFFFGLAAGSGVAIALYALIQKRLK
jgi:hypothetical protein